MDKDFARLVHKMGLMDYNQIKVCVEKSKSDGASNSSIAQISMESSFLKPNEVKKVTAILKNQEVYCPSCQNRYRAGNFETLNQFSCTECNSSLEPTTSPPQNVSAPAPDETDTKIPPPAYPSKLIEESATRVMGGGTPDPGGTNPLESTGSTVGFAPGEVVNDKLEIKKMLGRGGMGAVYLAYNRSLGRDVAVKIIASSQDLSPNILKRFEREAQTAAQVNHPNIVQVYGMDEDCGQRYILFEFVDGCSLRDMISQDGRVTPEKALALIGQIAEGLHVAHQKTILHRDIKPDNIFVDKAGLAKLGDFGLAKDTNASMLTQSGTIVGTPHYMSPEQAQGMELDGRADIYSLGATLYHALTGKTPYSAPDPMSVLYKQINEPLSFPKELKSSIPQPLRQLVKKMMAKEKWRRPKDTGKKFNKALILVEAYLQLDPKNKDLKRLQRKIQSLKAEWILTHKFGASKVVKPIGHSKVFSESEKENIERLIRNKFFLAALKIVSYHLKKNPQNKWLLDKRGEIKKAMDSHSIRPRQGPRRGLRHRSRR